MKTIETNGTRVSYLEAGQGQPVLLLHSSASNCGQWNGLVRSLRDRFHLLAPDLRGYGGTDAWPGQGAMSLSDEADCVFAVMDSVSGPVHLVGHSYGGAVALRVALEQPKNHCGFLMYVACCKWQSSIGNDGSY